jgi:hypothetical protein
MSFIYQDQDLIHKLLKISQTPQPDPKQFMDLAKELVKNLQTEFSGGMTFTSEKDNADLSQAHLVNVNELLYFLNFNQIKANGKSLVLRAQNFDLKQLGDDANLYTQFPAQGEAQYYVYRKALEAYLQDLKTKSKDNPIFSATINKLSTAINTELPYTAPKPEAAGNSNEQSIESGQQGTDGGPGKPGTSGTGTGTGSGSGTGSASATTSKVRAESLQNMVNVLPLNPNDVDFNRIREFFNYFRTILQNSQYAGAAEISKNMNDTEFYITEVQKMTRTGASQINLYEDPIGIGNLLKPPVTTIYKPFLNSLEYIVENTGRVINAFYAMHRTQLSENTNNRSLIEAQATGSNSYLVRNKESIQALINRYNEVVKFK